MGEDKIQELLLQLVQDMSFLKAKLSNIEERNDSMEEFVRTNMQDSKKQQISVFVSMGLAVFSAILSMIINLF